MQYTVFSTFASLRQIQLIILVYYIPPKQTSFIRQIPYFGFFLLKTWYKTKIEENIDTSHFSVGTVHGRVIVSPCNSSRPAQQLSGNTRKYYIAAEREQGG